MTVSPWAPFVWVLSTLSSPKRFTECVLWAQCCRIKYLRTGGLKVADSWNPWTLSLSISFHGWSANLDMLRKQKEKRRDLRWRKKNREYRKNMLRIKAALLKAKVKKRKRKIRKRKGLTSPGIFWILLINRPPNILRLSKFRFMARCWRVCVILPLL